MTAAPAYLSVDPRDVQHGDVLAGVPVRYMHPIEAILSDGITWWYGDACGVEMGSAGIGDRVQVVREHRDRDGEAGASARVRLPIPSRVGEGVARNHATASPTLSEPPRGITRSRGRWVLVP